MRKISNKHYTTHAVYIIHAVQSDRGAFRTRPYAHPAKPFYRIPRRHHHHGPPTSAKQRHNSFLMCFQTLRKTFKTRVNLNSNGKRISIETEIAAERFAIITVLPSSGLIVGGGKQVDAKRRRRTRSEQYA